MFSKPFSHINARLVLVSFLALIVSACSTSQTLDVAKYKNDSNYASIVVDAGSGKVLFEKNSDAIRYPASLAKMMTLYLVFDALKSGSMTLDTDIAVSSYAAGRPASKLYLQAGSTIKADTAIRALVVKSANDVASAVAEHLGGSEAAFASMMTAKAQKLGMRSTRFTNASGLPDPNMRTTARDMALLALALKRNHGEYYSFFKITNFSFNGKNVTGHNNVLASYRGADGLKTGYTRASGFNLATSAKRDGKSVVAVVLGGDSAAQRDAHMVELLDGVLAVVEKIIAFLIESEKLKSVLRKTKPLGEDRFENSAEHSWQTCLAAMLLLEEAPDHLDRLKVLKMLIIHDIVEIDAGDVFVYDQAARDAAFEAEAAAAARLFGLLDEHIGNPLTDLWHEFEAGQTPEAKFAKAADRVMPVIQNLTAGGQSWTDHGITKDQVLERNTAIADANPQLWELLRLKIETADFIADT
ncbi:MAG: HD domain-containing protein [Ahrensia sp.]|nr:HD domain-containing protein [Ahrensia sp.]